MYHCDEYGIISVRGTCPKNSRAHTDWSNTLLQPSLKWQKTRSLASICHYEINVDCTFRLAPCQLRFHCAALCVTGHEVYQENEG